MKPRDTQTNDRSSSSRGPSQSAQATRRLPATPLAFPEVARAVMAQHMIERPLLLSESRHETQKVLYVACISFFILFAVTFFDFLAFHN
ncbi:MAG: hypothetical protein NDI61_05835 [Bdellovibrionaceae bacterium]|nr:hypothetical protein [Pseudobdellovibrionaceae bacterium]